MTKISPKDVAASVRARLFTLARERGEDFQLLLTRYANERFLFRLAAFVSSRVLRPQGRGALHRLERKAASGDA